MGLWVRVRTHYVTAFTDPYKRSSPERAHTVLIYAALAILDKPAHRASAAFSVVLPLTTEQYTPLIGRKALEFLPRTTTLESPPCAHPLSLATVTRRSTDKSPLLVAFTQLRATSHPRQIRCVTKLGRLLSTYGTWMAPRQWENNQEGWCTGSRPLVLPQREPVNRKKQKGDPVSPEHGTRTA